MKKYFFLLFAVFLITNSANSQCPPYPVNIYFTNNMYKIKQGVPFSGSFYFKLPTQAGLHTLSYIQMTSITGFPAGITYTTSKGPNPTINGGETICFDISGTTSVPAGTYYLTILGNVKYATVPLFSGDLDDIWYQDFGLNLAFDMGIQVIECPNPVVAPTPTGNTSPLIGAIETYSVTSAPGLYPVWSVSGGTLTTTAYAWQVTVQWGAAGTGNLRFYVQETVSGVYCYDFKDNPITISAFAGDTLVVEENGAGGAFTSIGAALAVASSGKVIKIHPRAGGAAYIENVDAPLLTDLTFISIQNQTKYKITGDFTLRSGWEVYSADITGTVADSGSSATGEKLYGCKVTGSVHGTNNNINFLIENDSILAPNDTIVLFRGNLIGNYIIDSTNSYTDLTMIKTSSLATNDSIKIMGNYYQVHGCCYETHIAFYSSSQYVYVANNYFRVYGGYSAALSFKNLKLLGAGNNTIINNTIVEGNGTAFFFQMDTNHTVVVKNNLQLDAITHIWAPDDIKFTEYRYNYHNNSGSGAVDIFQTYTPDPTNIKPSNTTINADGTLIAGSDAINGGDPNAAYNDLNGTRNDAGAFGGPGSLANWGNWYRDADGDGYGSTGDYWFAYRKPAGAYVKNSTDCNDNDAAVHALASYYLDIDLDGYGSTTTFTECSLTPPLGLSVNSTDCSDANPSIHPGAIDIPNNGVDEDCSGSDSVSTGIYKNNYTKGISLFPNPVTRLVNIDLGNHYSDVSVAVIDVTGKVVSKTQASFAETVQLELTGASGLYFVRITNAEGTLNGAVKIQKVD